MTRDEIAHALQQYADAKQRHDVEAIVALRSEDCFDHNLPLGRRIDGREAIGAYFAQFFETLPDYAAHFDGEAFGEDTAVVWGRWTATLGDRAIDVPCAFVCTFRDGLVVGDTYYYDAATLAEQAGMDIDDLRSAAAAAGVTA